jgi:hypothetical protein
MSKRTLRSVILVTGLITALVHLVWLNISFVQTSGSPDLLFTLNGLGYLGLLALFFTNPEALSEQREYLHYIFMAFAFATIIAFLLLGDMGDMLGWFTKADEVILIIALWLHQQREAQSAGA